MAYLGNSNSVYNWTGVESIDLGNEAKKYANNITKAVPADFGNNV